MTNIYVSVVRSLTPSHSLNKTTIDIPVLFIQANRDLALLPSMSAHMDQYFKHLTRKEVDANHWVLWEAVEEVNNAIAAWLMEQQVTPLGKL